MTREIKVTPEEASKMLNGKPCPNGCGGILQTYITGDAYKIACIKCHETVDEKLVAIAYQLKKLI